MQQAVMDTSTALEASPSSSPSSSSSSSFSSPYDVFLSFSEDTRKTFTDHLSWTMKDAGIDFFMEENESIRRGENISDKVKQIIEGSRVSVIVFSNRYADSIWCLEELVQIMECRRTLKQMVLPIFYDLSHSDVIGTFPQAFQKHGERFHEDTDKQEKIQRWTDALTQAADLTVRVFRTTNGYEGMFIREIIEETTRQLKSPIPIGTAFSELQGIDSPVLKHKRADFREIGKMPQGLHSPELADRDSPVSGVSLPIERLSSDSQRERALRRKLSNRESARRQRMRRRAFREHALQDQFEYTWCKFSDSDKYHPSKSQDLLAMPSIGNFNGYPLPVSSIQGQWKKGRFIRQDTLVSVYLASNQETGALCEMKEVYLNPGDSESAERIKQLVQEVRILRTLTHRNIVRCYDSEVIDNHYCTYLEYFPVSIDKYSREHIGGESIVRSFTRHILSGLAFLHGMNIIHRNIRGANLRVDASGAVKLANFEIAEDLNEQFPLKGSSNWMAPEVMRTAMQNNADPGFAFAADIWSLGCTVIEMLTGRPPWSGLTGHQLMFKILHSIPDIPETLSAEGKDFLKLCFRSNTAERPPAVQLLEHSFVHVDSGKATAAQVGAAAFRAVEGTRNIIKPLIPVPSEPARDVFTEMLAADTSTYDIST